MDDPAQQKFGLVEAAAVIPKRINAAATLSFIPCIFLHPFILQRRPPNLGDALAFATLMPFWFAIWHCLTRPWIRRFDDSEIRIQKPFQWVWLGSGVVAILAGIGLLLLFGPWGFVGSPGQMAGGWLCVVLGCLAGVYYGQSRGLVLTMRDRRYSYTTFALPFPAVRDGNFEDVESIAAVKHPMGTGSASCIAMHFKAGGKTTYLPISDSWTDTQTIASVLAGIIGVPVRIAEQSTGRRSNSMANLGMD